MFYSIISNFNYFRPKGCWFFCPASCVFLLHIGHGVGNNHFAKTTEISSCQLSGVYSWICQERSPSSRTYASCFVMNQHDRFARISLQLDGEETISLNLVRCDSSACLRPMHKAHKLITIF